MDDLYFDADRKRIYMPGGEGYIDVFQMAVPTTTLARENPTAWAQERPATLGREVRA